MKNSYLLLFLIFLPFTIAGCATSTESKTYYFDEEGKMSTTKPAPAVAEKLEVYYFHTNARCYSCKAIGQYVNETMLGSYADQLQNGQIDYREINVDLPENKTLAQKYQATGSSLFINRIIDGQDNIEPDLTVWRLLSDEVEFKAYLEKKLNSYLGL